MSAVVFIGPSLEAATAATLLPARMLPPVRRGDIDGVLAEAERPSAIGIIDGQFFHALAISPKEVLRALDSGVRVYGGASMGALRAVELEPYGMIGVGRVFELYRSGRVEAEDEVAVVYDPETGRPLCEALVNMRLAAEDAQAAGVISDSGRAAFLQAARTLYFPQRTYASVLAVARQTMDAGEHRRLAAYLRKAAPNAKRADAVALLERMRADLAVEGPA